MEVDHMKGVNIEDALVGIERDTNFGLEISNVCFGVWKKGQQSLKVALESADPQEPEDNRLPSQSSRSACRRWRTMTEVSE